MTPQTTDYIAEHTITTRSGNVLVPHVDTTPEDVADELTAEYGRPATIDRGETAYWTVG